MAVGRLPESGADLCSQPTISRLENLPGATALKRMMAAMVELFCDSFEVVPRRILLDIDDTEDAVHGGQQLALFNAHYDSRCFLPIHIYEATTGKPVAVILRPGKTPDGAEVALVLRHVIGRIRARWPAVEIIVRGDGHGACPREGGGPARGDGLVRTPAYRLHLRLAGNSVLRRQVSPVAEDTALGRLAGEAEKVRRYGDFRYAAKSWKVERRVIARVEAGPQGADSRFIVTNLRGLPKALYEKVYCARGQAENLIKAHKLHLASDRTSCSKATANQFRLLIHTAAYWLMLTLRGLAPKTSFWRDAQFDTVRLCLIKIAGRVTEMVRHAKGAAADRDRRADHRVACRGDHRHGVGVRVRDIDLAAVRGHRHAEGPAADRDRRADHRVGRRGDHRDGVVGRVRDVSVLREALRAVEKTHDGDNHRRQLGNAKVHSYISFDHGIGEIPDPAAR